jgi:hypothetical protein
MFSLRWWCSSECIAAWCGRRRFNLPVRARFRSILREEKTKLTRKRRGQFGRTVRSRGSLRSRISGTYFLSSRRG